MVVLLRFTTQLREGSKLAGLCVVVIDQKHLISPHHCRTSCGVSFSTSSLRSGRLTFSRREKGQDRSPEGEGIKSM